MNFDSLFTLILALVIIIVGLGLGADSTFDDFRSAAKKPSAVLCGMASQYGFMPLCAFLLAQSDNISEYTAIGIILTGASPGGTTSNLFTFWAGGDVPLSITMSFCSTVGAFFMLPLIILVYIKSLSSESIRVPWANIFVSILLIITPTFIGLLVRKYNTKTKVGGKFMWDWLRVAASGFGGIFVISVLIIGFIVHWSKLETASWRLWLFAFAMEPMGAFFGYHASKVCGLTLKDHRTIAIECGIQNFTFTMVMITLSFGNSNEADEALLFPIMYGVAYLINSGWLVVFFIFDIDLILTKKVCDAFNALRGAQADSPSKDNAVVELKNKYSSNTTKSNEWELASAHDQGKIHHVHSVVPEYVDMTTARRLAGHLFDENNFILNADVETGMITRDQFMKGCHEKRGVYT